MQYRNSGYITEDWFDSYLFRKNLQGDIIGVYNESGTLLVSYTYDAWGNQTVTYSNGGASTAARYNPFRYRGYYYDSETGFYYLNSRYYDPETGRFINADSYISTGQGLAGNNMFAYCGNDPINRLDSNGELWFELILLTAVVLLVGITTTGCSDTAYISIDDTVSFPTYDDAISEANNRVFNAGTASMGKQDFEGNVAPYGVEYKVDVYYSKKDQNYYLTKTYTDYKQTQLRHRELYDDSDMIILAFTHYHPGVDDGTLSFSGDDNEVASGLEVIQYIVNTAGVIREDRNYLPSWKYDFLG